MQKLDRLVWAAGLSIHAYGRRIGIRTNNPAILPRLLDLLPPGWEPGYSPLVDHLFSLWVGRFTGRGKAFHLLYGGFERLARSVDLETVLHTLETHLHLYVGETASNRVFVHAGAVGWRGRAMLLPGVSRAGKSTLVAALLRAGASYYSDEYAVLDLDGRLWPFARRLSIRPSPAGTGAVRRCDPEEFGGRPAEGPLPVGLVAVTAYRAAATGRPQPLTQGRAVLELLRHTLSAQFDPEGAIRVLTNAVRPALLCKSSRGDAAETAERPLAALEDGGRERSVQLRRDAHVVPESPAGALDHVRAA